MTNYQKICFFFKYKFKNSNKNMNSIFEKIYAILILGKKTKLGKFTDREIGTGHETTTHRLRIWNTVQSAQMGLSSWFSQIGLGSPVSKVVSSDGQVNVVCQHGLLCRLRIHVYVPLLVDRRLLHRKLCHNRDILLGYLAGPPNLKRYA